MDKKGILRIKVIEGAAITLENLKEDDAVNPQLTEGKKALALYDACAFFSITPEAEKFLRSGILNKSRIATAVLTDKFFVRLLVNFMNNFTRLKSPLKMFGREEAALKWLYSFKEN
ncbi:MAG: STAS/SEC14 domain-containing protein [Bacteroidetes bacterium]|nr:MAG: STAS/SEC14 domain-containing protein [Bacteroidota bacterium]